MYQNALSFCVEVLQQLDHDGVPEDIGMVAGMEGVAITEHDEAG